jgi:DNA-binding Lrp family transcriptional regulator
VRECPEVRDCYFMTGDADYLLHVAAADTADYERIYKAYLSRFPGVARIRSSFALRTISKRTAYSENHTG